MVSTRLFPTSLCGFQRWFSAILVIIVSATKSWMWQNQENFTQLCHFSSLEFSWFWLLTVDATESLRWHFLRLLWLSWALFTRVWKTVDEEKEKVWKCYFKCFFVGMKVNTLDLSPNYAGALMGITNGIGALAGIAAVGFRILKI